MSDLHLQATEPATFEAWRRYMQTTRADAVFILGDLFEVWVGDDVVEAALLAAPADHKPARPPDNFETRCAEVLRATAQRLPVFFMHGNRDFLIGSRLMEICQMHLLADPTVLSMQTKRWLLTHGDLLCLDDSDYLQFRQQVHRPTWQQHFLNKPLAERQQIAQGLRHESQQQHQRRQQSGWAYVDVDPTAASQWLAAAQSKVLIHGHTHRPAQHDLGGDCERIVLSDWDAAAQPPRAEVLRLLGQAWQRIPLTAA